MDYDVPQEESVSQGIVRVVSALEDRDPVNLPPLSGVLDPDALDALSATRADGDHRIGGHVAFVFSECRITVDHGEYITAELLSPVRAREAGPEPSR